MTTDTGLAATAPREIGIDEPGSFGWRVFHERHPALIRRILAATPYPPRAQRRLSRLVHDSQNGLISPLPDEAPDFRTWHEWGNRWFGIPWRRAPFLWAEAYFYRALLEALDYHTPGAWSHIDPFTPMKDVELHDPELDTDLRTIDATNDLPPTRKTAALLRGCLWGNRADLGFRIDNDLDNTDTTLIADATIPIVEALEAGQDHVILVADNAGRELLADLLLIDHLLRAGMVERATLHLKSQPHYVSDATVSDALACLRRLESAGRTAGQAATSLFGWLADGRLELRAHPFSCAPLPFRLLPDDLADEWARASLILFKGDLNYRRLVGDQHHPATLSLVEATRWLDTPFAALRTLKSDVVIGLTTETIDKLDHGPDGDAWRANGAHGLIQARL